MKIKKISFQNIVEGIKNVFQRFPLPVLFSVITCVLFILEIESGYKYHYKEHILKAIFVSILGFMLSLAIKLFSEKKEYSLNLRSVINILMVAFMIYLYFTLPLKFRERDFIVMTIFYLSTFMGLMFAYIRKEDSEPDFGRYNVDMIIRIVVSMIFAQILFFGIVSAIFAIEQLFDFGIHENLYGDIFAVVSTLFAPMYFLAGVPDRKEKSLESYEFPKAMKVLTIYILLPMVIGYIGILYVYMFKVIFTQDWPKGIVSYLIISFSFVGINSLILSSPLKKSEKYKGLETYTKYFFRALIPLIIMLFFAISKRVGQYGITEKRYFVILLALWLLGVSVYFVINKKAKLKYLPITLSIISLLSLFGPWSCFNISITSQKGRLEKLLTNTKILVDGKIIKNETGDISFDDRKGISSIVSYFYDTHGIDKVEFLKETIERLEADTLNKKEAVSDNYYYRDKDLNVSRSRLVKEGFGFQLINNWQTGVTNKENISFQKKYYNKSQLINIKEYDYLLDDVANYQSDTLAIIQDGISIELDRDRMQVVIYNSNDNIVLDLKTVIKGLVRKNKVVDQYNQLEPDEMTYEGENDRIKYRIIFTSFSFMKEDDDIKNIRFPVFSMYFTIK
ncbi:MAG: DUF4153 domain-containing protein [Candidatus Delongbacteria bacterium]|nr:DUF4153 domain-containing protein [Candidatus Delongbacteria bacterium]